MIPNQIYLKRSKELDYDIEELESYRNKRFGPEGDWLVQEKILIQPIQDEVLAIVQQIAEKNKKRKDSISRLRELRKLEIKRKRDSLLNIKRKIKT